MFIERVHFLFRAMRLLGETFIRLFSRVPLCGTVRYCAVLTIAPANSLLRLWLTFTAVDLASN